MKKNKAFTLIELIVVLVILSIIALIVTPLVLKIVDKADISAKKRSVDEYGHAIELALASYELEHGDYPDSLDKLKIEYSGNEVKCNVAIIRKTGEVYLSECSVQGVKVKDKSTDDGYYQYGRTNREYIDLYGKELEKQIHNYVKKNGVTPSDLSQFNNIYSSDVLCEIKKISNGSSVYLSQCSVDNIMEKDEMTTDGYYHYGMATAVEFLINKTNDKTLNIYTDGNIHEMYTFTHEATEQTEPLTDYRYIGNDPYNYVTFNNELWRIIGVFTVEDENGNKEQHIKIIRDNLIDATFSSTFGWANDDSQIYLNGDYYNSLDNDSKNMIYKAKYYLGVIADSDRWSGDDLYEMERGHARIGSSYGANWIGNIGLMYPSDYVYAYANSVDDICFTNIKKCNNRSNSWLYKDAYQWLISQFINDAASLVVDTGNMYSVNMIYSIYYGGAKSIRPAVYLSSDILIDSGNGTSEKPYILKNK